jgi:pilus assembly protein Flp/PilA
LEKLSSFHFMREVLGMRIGDQARLAVTPFWAACQRIWQDEAGQDLIEYALVACLLGLGAVASIRPIGNKLSEVFNAISSNVNNAV